MAPLRGIFHCKSDGIDAELLLRTLLAWLRGELNPRIVAIMSVCGCARAAIFGLPADTGFAIVAGTKSKAPPAG
jgi:hypothetical protein